MKLKVGQIRQDCKGSYVITKIGNYFIDIIYSDGETQTIENEKIFNLEKDKIITEYKGWINAINSEEFRNNVCNW